MQQNTPFFSPASLVGLPKQAGLWLLYCCIPLIFLPKINLIGVAGQTAGLRIDDLILFAALGLFILIWLLNKRIVFAKIELLLFAFVGLSLLTTLMNQEIRGILYSLRLLEYFVFFYVGVCAFCKLQLHKIAEIFLLTNFVLIALQLFGVIGAFVLGNYEKGVPIGIGSGSWEIGLLFNMAVAILAFSPQVSPIRLLAYYLAVLVALLIIGARVPAANHVLLLGIYLYHRGTSRHIFISLSIIALVSLLAIAGGAFKAVENSALAERATTLFSNKNADAIALLWHEVEPKRQISYDKSTETYAENDFEQDFSLLLRVEKTFIALKYWLQQPLLFQFFGVGAGTWGTAVDMGYIRLLTEHGILGFCLFWYALWNLSRYAGYTKTIMLLFAVNMLTLDAYLAYKVMSFYLLTCGYAFMAHVQKNN